MLGCCTLGAFRTFAQEPFQFPTANHALYDPDGGGARFFVGTVGKPWTSGCFGCVRSDGSQMHEGLDIRCLQRDKHGEPTDPVMATADGTVAYINLRPSLSNYGNYVVVHHRIEGIDIYSLYAHLSAVREGLRVGTQVKQGEVIATMGHTANTKEPITKDRAHVHFELNLFATDRFSSWFKHSRPGERNDHGDWNGQNLMGIDVRQVLLAERDQGPKFSLLNFLRNQTELFRVVVRKTDFPWLRRYPMLVKPNPVAQKEGVAGYEIAFNYNGVAFELIPRAASEIKGKNKYQLLSVNETEEKANHCRKYLRQLRGRWELSLNSGTELLDMITE